MKKLSLKTRILNFLRKEDGYVPKGRICDLARDNGYYLGETTGRALRLLENEGQVEVEYRAGHAWYKATAPKEIIQYKIEGREPLTVKMF